MEILKLWVVTSCTVQTVTYSLIYRAEDADGKLHQNVYNYLQNYVVSYSEFQ